MEFWSNVLIKVFNYIFPEFGVKLLNEFVKIVPLPKFTKNYWHFMYRSAYS